MTEHEPPQRVTVVNFDVSFGNLVGLLVKLAIAAVPALLFLAAIAFALFVAVYMLLPKSMS